MSFANKKSVLVFSVVSSIILVSIGIIFTDIPSRDVAHRYAPMSEAFANGCWQYAFHLRIQCLQTVSGGIFAWIFQCNGFLALQIASALFFLGGAWLVWKLFREIYQDKPYIATAAVAFYSIFPYNIHMAYSGLRDSAKTFIILLTAWALIKIYRNTRQYTGYILLGIGCALSMICRADMVMTGLFLLFTGMVIECQSEKRPQRSLIAAAVTGMTVLLSSLINYRVSGHAMPDYRFAELFNKITGHPAQITDVLCLTVLIIIVIAAGAAVTALLLRKIHAGFFIAAMLLVMTGVSIYIYLAGKPSDPVEFVKSIVNGNYNAVGIFCLLTIVYLIYYKRFTGEEFLLCLILLSNMFFNIVPMEIFHKVLYVSDRYLFTAIPLLSGFFAIGINEIWQIIRKKMNQKYANIILVLVCTAISGAFIFHALQPTLKNYTREKLIKNRKGILELKNTLIADYKGEQYKDTAVSINRYQSQKAPFVLFDSDRKITVAAYMAGGSMVCEAEKYPDYFVGDKLPERFAGKAILLREINFGRHSKKLWRIE